jgi:hypothetical protein
MNLKSFLSISHAPFICIYDSLPRRGYLFVAKYIEILLCPVGVTHLSEKTIT